MCVCDSESHEYCCVECHGYLGEHVEWSNLEAIGSGYTSCLNGKKVSFKLEPELDHRWSCG